MIDLFIFIYVAWCHSANARRLMLECYWKVFYWCPGNFLVPMYEWPKCTCTRVYMATSTLHNVIFVNGREHTFCTKQDAPMLVLAGCWLLSRELVTKNKTSMRLNSNSGVLGESWPSGTPGPIYLLYTCRCSTSYHSLTTNAALIWLLIGQHPISTGSLLTLCCYWWRLQPKLAIYSLINLNLDDQSFNSS